MALVNVDHKHDYLFIFSITRMGQSDSTSATSRRVQSASSTSSSSSKSNQSVASTSREEDRADFLQDDLDSLREQLLLKDEEIMRLSRIRGDVEAELEDLTASLFEEAHKMVRIEKYFSSRVAAFNPFYL